MNFDIKVCKSSIHVRVQCFYCPFSRSLRGVSYLRELYSNGATHLLEILHWTFSPEADTVEFVSSVNNSIGLRRMGLVNCTLLANMQDLISSELAGNWHNLKHHVDHGHPQPDKIRDVITDQQQYKGDSLEHRVLRRHAEYPKEGDKCPQDGCKKETSRQKEDGEIQKCFSQYVCHHFLFFTWQYHFLPSQLLIL